MAKKKQGITVSTDNEVSTSLFEDKIKWEELTLARTDAVSVLTSQQQLVLELCKLQADKINADSKVSEIITGLLKTYNDLGKDIVIVSLKHASVTTVIDNNGEDVTVPTAYKVGVIDNDDDEMLYINIASEYIAISEKVAHITSSVYIDVLTRLNIDSTTIPTPESVSVELAKEEEDGK